MIWRVRVGNVRTISIIGCEESDWLLVVVRKQDGGEPTHWNVKDKRLADLAHTDNVLMAAMLTVLYDALPTGQRAWLTRWLNETGEWL